MARFADRARWSRLSALLDEALDRDTDERAAWLAGLRAEDPDAASELQAMLDAAGAAARFMTGHAAADVGAGRPGETLGAYTLERPIGEGGMGCVWLARRSDGRYTVEVAVKLLRLALVGRAGGERFRREGAILARLTHPNIARLIDAGVSAAGHPFLVLEHVQGERIDRFCDTRRLDAASRLRLFLDVLGAVAHSHASLIVHRDIKPTNVLVTDDGVVKLLDFGIAKLLDEGAPGEATELTREGGRALTPEYAAPEQLLGEPITTATDVYSLGLLLYLLLTGQHPVATGTRSTAELVKAVLNTPAARLSEAVVAARTAGVETLDANAEARSTTPDKLARSLRGDLDNIVGKALKKDPAERYLAVNAFADDLRRHLAHEPVSARADSLAYRAAKFVRRNRIAVAGGALAGAAILAGLAGTITQAERAATQARQAQQERDRAVRELTHAEATDEFLGFLLQQGADKPFTTPQLLARGEKLIDRQFAADPALRARLLLALANLYVEAMEHDKAGDLLQRAKASAQRVGDVALQASIDCSLAAYYGDENAFDRAMPLFDAAIARLGAAPDGALAVRAQCFTDRSMVSMLRGDAEAALADAQAALLVLGTPRPGQRSLAVTAYSALADARGMRGEMAAAVSEYHHALDELGAMGRARTAQAVALLNGLGLRLSKAGQTLQAAAAYEQGLAIAREIESADSVGPGLETNYAKLLVELGRPRDAIPLFDDAMALATQRGHERSIGLVSLLLAPAWCAERDLERCQRLLDSARTHMEATLPRGHAMLGTLEMEEAGLAMDRHRPGAAREHLKRGLSIFEAAKEWNPNRLRTLTWLARADLELGDLAAARAHADQAVAQSRAALGGFVHSAWLGEALVAQAEVRRARGDASGSRSALEEALTQLHDTTGDAAPGTLEALRMR